MAYYGPKGGGRSAATAIAVPRPTPLRIPGPPRGMLPAALLATALIYTYRKATEETGPPPEWVDHGTYWTVPGDVVPDASNDGQFIYSKRFFYYKAVPRTDRLYKCTSSEQEHYGEGPVYENSVQRAYYPTKVYPPHWACDGFPGAGSGGGVGVGGVGAPGGAGGRGGAWGAAGWNWPGSDRAGDVFSPGVGTQDDTGTGGGVGVGVGPGVNVGTDRGIGVSVGPRTAVLTNPMANGREVKTAAQVSTYRFISLFFGTGGEIMDFTRCLLWGLGETYVNSKGIERVIPRSQWVETLSTKYGYSKLGKSVTPTSDGSYDARLDGIRDPSQYVQLADHAILGGTPQGEFRGRRMVQCMFENWLEDAVYAQFSDLNRRAARDIGLLWGPIGVESMIAIMNGEVPLADLI